MKCLWCNNSVYDGIERTWKTKKVRFDRFHSPWRDPYFGTAIIVWRHKQHEVEVTTFCQLNHQWLTRKVTLCHCRYRVSGVKMSP